MTTPRNPETIKERLRLSSHCIRCSADTDLVVHHIIAIADGGADEVGNTATLCSACHLDWHSVFEGHLTWEDFLNSPPSRFIQKVFSIEALDEATVSWVRSAFLQGSLSDREAAISSSSRQRERQREGIEAAKARGAYRGSKARIDPLRVREMLSRGMGPAEVARLLGINRATVYRLRQ